MNEFRRVIGGLDQDDVTAFINRVQADVDQRRETLHELRDELRRIQAQIEVAAQDRPSFSELGSAFEEALRMAEDQSTKLVSEALIESSRMTSEAQSRAKTLVDTNEMAYSSAVEEATTEARRLALAAEQEIARSRAELAENKSQLAIERSKAERVASQSISDAERLIAKNSADVQKELDVIKRDSIETARAAKEFRTTTEFELRQQQEDARIQIREILAEAERYSIKTYADADDRTAQSVDAANEITSTADAHSAQIRQRITDLLDSAELRARNIREQADLSAARMSAEAAAFVTDFVDVLEQRIQQARNQMEDMNLIAHNLKMLVNGFDLGEINATIKSFQSGETLSAELIDE